jgi:hypothetical protein
VLLRSVRTVIDPLECQANRVDVKKKRGHFRYDAIVAQFLDFLARHPKRPMRLMWRSAPSVRPAKSNWEWDRSAFSLYAECISRGRL